MYKDAIKNIGAGYIEFLYLSLDDGQFQGRPTVYWCVHIYKQIVNFSLENLRCL